ncbi:hypothetical protein PVAP13_5NG454040 [Panicum virgatum]|uniref:Uncharacterized protein n=1 Tax=Panicum virgatum TaxID=38727 RepID=A0A8T0S132_PANVG|nr:hypothetical protein PVAP13_5NG454040 [Panicum virgatum]
MTGTHGEVLVRLTLKGGVNMHSRRSSWRSLEVSRSDQVTIVSEGGRKQQRACYGCNFSSSPRGWPAHCFSSW